MRTLPNTSSGFTVVEVSVKTGRQNRHLHHVSHAAYLRRNAELHRPRFGWTSSSLANGKYGTVEFDPSQLNRTGVVYPGWHLLQQLTVGNGTTYGIGADSEGNPWWSEAYSDTVATRNFEKQAKTTALLMRDPGYDARKALFTPDDIDFYDSIGSETWGSTAGDPNPWSEMPRRLSTDKNGDTVWVPLWAQTSLAEINIHTSGSPTMSCRWKCIPL